MDTVDQGYLNDVIRFQPGPENLASIRKILLEATSRKKLQNIGKKMTNKPTKLVIKQQIKPPPLVGNAWIFFSRPFGPKKWP